MISRTESDERNDSLPFLISAIFFYFYLYLFSYVQ